MKKNYNILLPFIKLWHKNDNKLNNELYSINYYLEKEINQLIILNSFLFIIYLILIKIILILFIKY